MNPCYSRTIRRISANAVLALIWGSLCLWILAAPVLLAHSHSVLAAAAYFPFSFFCHQNPARSFFIMQYPIAVCHRCFGIYLGLFFGSLLSIPYNLVSWRTRRFMILAAALPLLLDALLPFIGLWTSTWWSRSCTGLLLGFLISPLLVQGVSELRNAVLQRSFITDALSIKGDFS
jgi:uncharacterized membrane protein